jgi:signal transduction histidine kinase
VARPRTDTAAFLLLLLGPAVLLAWLGFMATVPLERELRRSARATTQRVATAFAAALPARIERVLQDEQHRLRELAEQLAADLPAAGADAFAACDDHCAWPLLVRRADGDMLLPAPPRDLALPFLEEWPRYRAFELDSLDPTHAAVARTSANEFVAPSLRARALAHVPAASGDELATTLADLRDEELAAAGPRVIERLLASAAGRRRLTDRAGLLYSVPATEAKRLAWFLALGDELRAAAQQLRVRHERESLPRLQAPLPGGAALIALLDPDALCQRLATSHEDCALHCETLGAEATSTAPADADDRAQLEVATALGQLRVHAVHGQLPALLRSAVRRQWLTGIGVLSLFGVMVLGIGLVRRTMRREAEARALRDQFLANVSHDLKTPLTSLRLHAEMLTDARLDPETRGRYAAVVHAEGARMSALVEDLLDVSALQQGRRRIEPEPLDLAAAVQAQAAAWRPRLERDQVGLRVTTTTPAEALADPTALGRILTNLLQNAVRHGRPARDGGPSWIELRAGPGPVLEVRDNGPGVPEHLRERVFGRFERAAATGEGMGLGLSLSRELAIACGGTLRCLDDGSTLFRLELPAVPAEELP